MVGNPLRRWSFLALVFCVLSIPARAATLPQIAGWLDVSQAPYNVRPFVQTRAFVTRQLNRACRDASATQRSVFLPAGVYSLSDTLHFDAKRARLRGAGKSQTTLFLASNASGFGEETRPKAVLQSGAAIEDVSLEVGAGNDGAVGLLWNAAPGSVLRRLQLRGESGALGLDASAEAFVQDVEINGFRVGVRASGAGASTWEHLRLEGQSEVGMQAAQNAVWLRDVRGHNRVPALRIEEPCLCVVLSRARLIGAGRVAVERDAGTLLVRDLQSGGYEFALRDGERFVRGPLQEWRTSSRRQRQTENAPALFLPVEDTPPLPNSDERNWVNVAEFGAVANDDRDDSRALQRAVDALSDPTSPDFGKTTIFFPNFGDARYCFQTPVRLHGYASRIEGNNSTFQTQDAALFQVGEVTIGTLWLSDFRGETNGAPAIEHDSPCDVAVRDVSWSGGAFYRAKTNAGKLWLENARFSSPDESTVVQLAGEQNVWLRSIRFNARRAIENASARLWALGVWFPASSTLVENGGESEILGAWNDASSLS